MTPSNYINKEKVYTLFLIPKNNEINKNKVKSYLSKFGVLQKFEFEKKHDRVVINIKFEKALFLKLNNNHFGELIIERNNYVKVINFKENSLIKIFNLFSTFGNIKEVIIDKIYKEAIVINYKKLKFAINCKKYWNDFCYKNSKIYISFYKNFFYDSKIYNKYTIKDNNQRYFNKNYNINTPINKLYFFNIDKNFKLLSFSEILFKYFKLFILKKYYYNNIHGKEKISFIVEFNNTDNAIKALMLFHNKIFNNCNFKMKVSFCHNSLNLVK